MAVKFDPFIGQLQIVPTVHAERLSVIPSGAINGVNRTFTFPSAFSQVGVYLNGVRLIANDDYVPIETGGPGTGFNAVLLSFTPEPGVTPDVISADYVVA
jgi:hypothetical protein